MTTTTITPEDHIALLRHLASGKTLDAVALIMQLDRSDVLDVASRHGYPDPQKLAWAADVLVEKLDQEAAPTEHPQAAEVLRSSRPQTPGGGASTPPSPGPTSRPQPAAPPPPAAGEGLTIRQLIEEGKAHSSKRIQAAATKAETAVDRLLELVEADREKEAERRRQAEERAAAEAEVAELEKQLAEAKAKLRPARTSTSSAPPAATADGPTASEIRAWAAEAGVECAKSGKVPAAVREAYKAAHALEDAS